MGVKNNRVYIISLKFAPGLKKEFIVIGENLQKHGLNVKYVISNSYSKLDLNCERMIFVETKDGIKGMINDSIKYFSMKKIINIFNNDPPNFVLFYNPHPLNPKLAYIIKKKFPDTILALYLHDPYKPDKKPYGLKRSLYINIAEFIQGLTINYMDYIISPSEYSSELFKMRFPNVNCKNFIAPLLIPDANEKIQKDRKYFTMIGIAHNATGHDTFIDLINYVAEKNLKYEFCLISSSNLNNFLRKLNDKGRCILKIINKSIITEYEINEIITQSYAVFRLDKEVTQSGVIPVCYMNSTPIIARDIRGLTQHVWHKETGYIVPNIVTYDDLIEAMEFIKENFLFLSKNSRQKYEEIWAEWNFERYYMWLIELLTRGKSV